MVSSLVILSSKWGCYATDGSSQYFVTGPFAIQKNSPECTGVLVNYTGGKPLPPSAIGFLPDTQNCGLRMRRECFLHHRFQSKPLISETSMHHGTCVKHMSWCMSRSLTKGGGENVHGIPGACAARNFAYLVRGPWQPDALMLLCWWQSVCGIGHVAASWSHRMGVLWCLCGPGNLYIGYAS